MKVVITNAVTLNGGDAAILQAITQIVGDVEPAAEIDVFDSQADIARRYHPSTRFQTLLYQGLPAGSARRLHQRRILLAIRLYRRNMRFLARALTSKTEARAIETYLQADLVISTGGTYLVEHYDLRHRLFELEVARACGKRVVFFTQSLGPFRNPENVRALAEVFADSPLILLRDARSRDHLVSLGVDAAKPVILPDAVFAMADEQLLAAAETRELPRDRPLRVGISVRSWSHFRGRGAQDGMAGYERGIAGLVTHLVVERGATVLFVSTCQGVPEYWTQDPATAKRIAAMLSPEVLESVIVDDDFHAPGELSALLGTLDLVVATRMHAAILALNAGTPVLPIAYEFKTEELFAALQMSQWVTRIEDATGPRLIAQLEGFLATLQALRKPLFEAVRQLRRDAWRAADLLRGVCA